jgi:hypothetical protein
MTKIQLIDQIRQYNHSVRLSFLEQFDEDALEEYLESLQVAHSKNLKLTIWTGQQPARMRMVS